MNKENNFPWKRKGIFYIATVVVEKIEGDRLLTLTITRKLDFIAYHLIKKFHGEKKLIEMGTSEKLRN